MAENKPSVARAVSVSPDEFLAAPSEYLFINSRHRSASVAPSFRSTQSNVTIVEDIKDDASVKKVQVLRQQTFKIRRKFSLFDRIKGLWDPKGLIKKMETSIEFVPPDVLDEKMLDQNESPFIVDVHVSPKVDSTKYHKIRCWLDTGCLQGNFVSQDLVNSLGYTKADYEPLSFRERQGGQTVTGELLTVDAAVLLSWHHNTSPHRYRKMRFLVSSCTKVDMIIGARSIIKHNLMAPPVFMMGASAGKRALNTLKTDPELLKLRGEVNEAWTKQQNYKEALEKEEAKPKVAQDAKSLKDFKSKLEEWTHKRTVRELYAEARKAELPPNVHPHEARRLRAQAKEEDEQWELNHPAPKPKKKAAGGQAGRSRINSGGPKS